MTDSRKRGRGVGAHKAREDALVLAAAQDAAAERGYDPSLATLGRWDYLGRRQVFAASRYLGCVTADGRFVADRRWGHV